MASPDCPERSEIASYLLGKLADEEAERIATHLDGCADCEAVVDRLLVTAEGAAGEPASVAGRAEGSSDRPSWILGADAACEPPSDPGGSVPERPFESGGLGRLGEYQLLEELGQGGMGTIYRAVHLKLGRPVALKVLPVLRMTDRRAVARFQREMIAAGRLDHPNIVRTTDAGEDQGVQFLVMECLDGFDLGELVDRCGALPAADACELVRQGAVALQCAHEHGLVHRDVKPSNLMLTRPGVVKLLDLGLARFQAGPPSGDEMTSEGRPMGTADYIAPEQVSDTRSVDIRADIYSLGCTFYKLLAGEPPFGDSQYKSSFDKMAAHRDEPIPPITEYRNDLPAGLVAVLDRMLAKRPRDRFSTPAEVAEALGPFCVGGDVAGLVDRAEAHAPVRRSGDQTGMVTEGSRTTDRTATPSGLAPTRLGESAGPRASAATVTAPELPVRGLRRGRWLVPAGLAGLALVGILTVWAVFAQVRRDAPGSAAVPVPDRAEPFPPVSPVVDPSPPQPIQPSEDRDETPATASPEAPDVGHVSNVPTTQRHAGNVPHAMGAKRPTIDSESTGPSPPRELARAEPEPRERPKPEEPSPPLADRIQPEPPELKAGDPLGRTALVARPAPIDGVLAWTLETRAHRGPIYQAAFHPKGDLVATACGDGAVRLWNWREGSLARIFLGHDGPVTSAVWSPDGSVLATGGRDGTIRLWDSAAGRSLRTLRGHAGEVLAVAFSPDGLSLASGGSAGAVKLWDVPGGTVRQNRGEAEGPVRSLAFSPDGKTLAAAGGNGAVLLWQIASGKPARRLSAHPAEVRGVAFSPNGRVLAAATAGSRGLAGLRLWRATTGEPLPAPPGHDFGDDAVAWSPGGERLATLGAAGDGEIRVWAAETGALLDTWAKPSGTGADFALAFSPGGDVLAAGGTRGTLQLGDLQSGRVSGVLPACAADALAVDFSPDETALACGFQDGSAAVFEVDSGSLVSRIEPAAGPVDRVVFSPDGKLLATACGPGRLVDVWEVATGGRSARLEVARGPVTAIAFSPNGKQIALGGVQAQLFDARTGERVSDLGARGNVLAWSPDGTLAGGQGGDLRLGTSPGRPGSRTLSGPRGDLLSAAWSPDGKTMAASCEDGRIYLWDVTTGRRQATLPQSGSPAQRLVWLDDGERLISASRSEVCLWECRSETLQRRIAVDGGAVAPGRRLVAVPGPSSIRLVKLEDEVPVRTMVALAGESWLAVSPEGHFSGASGVAGEIVSVLDREGGQQVLSLEEFTKKYGSLGGPPR